MKKSTRLFAVLTALLLCLCACAAAEETPMLAGGWTLCEDGVMTEDAQRAFDMAIGNFEDTAEIKAVRLLGTQVVAGVNYSVLTLSKYPDGEFYSVLTIYADLEGDATVMFEENITLGVPNSDPEEDGQNPVMNFIGEYIDRVSERAVLTVSCVDENRGLLVVDWANSADSGVKWNLTCEFDPDTGVFTYTDGARLTYTCDENGNLEYIDEQMEQRGTFVVQAEDNTLAWFPEGEDADVGCVFEWAY